MTNQDRRHRSWDPYANALTEKAKAICEEALQDQFDERRRRSANALRKTNREKSTVEALICDVVAHTLADAHALDLSIALSNEALTGKKAPAINRGVPDRLKDLQATGWLKVELGKNYGEAKRSTLKAGDKLLLRMKELGVTIDDVGRHSSHAEDLVELRGAKRESDGSREILKVPDTSETQRLKEQVRRLNECFAAARIDQVSTEHPSIDTHRRSVRRYFLDGSLVCGGRLTGPAFWLSVEKVRRRSGLLLDGEPIAELDLKSAMPSIAYAHEGLVIPHDPYVPLEFSYVPRDELKIAMMKFLWDVPKKGARLPNSVSHHVKGPDKHRRVYEAMCRHNEPIAKYLLAEEPQGARFMFDESEIIINATERCYEAGITALPLHDALIVPVSKADAGMSIFEGAFKDRLGVLPVITQDWPEVDR
ncbi:hypothetical protein [Ponticaulis sp.]|uniref:hypothetical protein n=1 Tax=Ponticaulis sp. TaxID=2020902 RepID=UPI000C39E1B1|nr:hypothetical protein [Ponticaulis sp.]MAJ10562.1 hypothetical protein [Ponticaulis sp.]HBH89769.1 hypothetical protein [Hyphomonadaceae bacterium]|tara:strand:- start:268 stop:1533 length:1266 start_codon:yes stop_codon:yes gene_type:complete